MAIRSKQVAVTTTGSAGSASGNTDSERIVGAVVGMAINYHANAPGATTDITITHPQAGNLYAKSNSATDIYVVPQVFAVDNAAAALTNNVTPQFYCVDGKINVALAQCDALTNAVVVTIYYDTEYPAA